VKSSFDNSGIAAWGGGCQGLIEFRAIESLPQPAMDRHDRPALDRAGRPIVEPSHRPSGLEPFVSGSREFLLPAPSGVTLEAELPARGMAEPLETAPFRQIGSGAFRCCSIGSATEPAGDRRALEPWPLLCETAGEGGSTSPSWTVRCSAWKSEANSSRFSRNRLSCASTPGAASRRLAGAAAPATQL